MKQFILVCLLIFSIVLIVAGCLAVYMHKELQNNIADSKIEMLIDNHVKSESKILSENAIHRFNLIKKTVALNEELTGELIKVLKYLGWLLIVVGCGQLPIAHFFYKTR